MKTYKRFITEAFRLSPKDKKVIDAFTSGKIAQSDKLMSDGNRLDGRWMGGNGIAVWELNKINFNDLGSKSAQIVQKAIRKSAPKNKLNERMMDQFHDRRKGDKLSKDEIIWSGKGDAKKKLVVTKRGTNPDIRAPQDDFSMWVTDNNFKVIKHWGSHPSLNGAKKFLSSRVNEAIMSGAWVLVRNRKEIKRFLKKPSNRELLSSKDEFMTVEYARKNGIKLKEAFVDFDDKTNKEVEFPKAIIRLVARLTDENDHNQARIMVANELKNAGNRSGAGYVKTYSTFLKVQQQKGEMSQSLIKSRFNTDKNMKQELQRTFSNWKKVWMAL